MIEFHCPDCHQLFQAREESAGNTVWCSRCSKRVPIPLTAQPSEVLEALPAGPADAPFAFAAGPPAEANLFQDRGPYADCPHCRHPGWADRVGFTWWGGLLGPALFCHVKCRRCYGCYNGKTGKDNATAIAIYLGAGVGVGLLVLMAMVCAGIASR